jgi:uncharacterized protein
MVKSKALDGETWVLVFDRGDEAFGGLESFAREQELTAASFTGIGAFREATLGYFDWESREYEELPDRAASLSVRRHGFHQQDHPARLATVVAHRRRGDPAL